MASSNSIVTTLELCLIKPSSHSPESAFEFSLPLTFFDTFWFKFYPVERIFFYKLPESSPSFFNSVIIPQLKHSLSLTLLHFLPLAGALIWKQESTAPIILYTPNDAVSVKIAESNSDFHHLSSDEPRQAAESHPYIPELEISESRATVLALQITNFPNQGFCIGFSSHHAILDGKSITMFIKAWAQICKEKSHLSLELTPFYDRTLIHDPEEIAMEYLNNWGELTTRGLEKNPKNLKLLSTVVPQHGLVRATFNLSREDINIIRNKVMISQKNHQSAKDSIRLSSFVVSYAYVIFCRVKAKELNKDGKICIAFTGDCRQRLNPPIPDNYFGNCVTCTNFIFLKTEVVAGEDGVFAVAKAISDEIQELDKVELERQKGKLKKIFTTVREEDDAFGVAGSSRFEVYKADFGWGRPEKVEVTSVDRTGAISMAESRDGSGGVEFGIVMEKEHMDRFLYVFGRSLKEA